MARHRTQGRVRHQIRSLAEELSGGDSIQVRSLLPPQRVQQAVQAEGVQFRDCLFTPLVTLWTFLMQVLSPDGSCREAVSKLLAWVAGQDSSRKGPDAEQFTPETGPYCKARQRLPEKLVQRLATESGQELHQRYPASRLLGGRPVKMVDGTTASMPDTPENQKEYPQPAPQKPGLGFPMARLVAILSLNCAAVLGLAIGPYAGKQSGELALFRTLMDDLQAGDVVLADRYYASYWMIAALWRRGVDSLFRQHQCRPIDFRAGRRLGKDDHILTVPRPTQRPVWMDRQTFEQMPANMELRELRLQVAQRGFRVRTLVLVTTLLDAELYSREELARAFRCRWYAELDLRAIKQTMNLSVLRCKTPAMVRKEIWMRLLAYNLVRATMAVAAEQAGMEPREVSFAGAVQTINAFVPVLELADARDVGRLWRILLRAIARHRVGNRPDRYEPRAVKRRAKPIAYLTVPREQARRRLATTVAAKD
jgi:hypothetical protein